jgi:hypothetical protein
MHDVSSTGKMPDSLPSNDGYRQLLGVPIEAVEHLRELHEAALDGRLSADAWTARHAEVLTGAEPDVDSAELNRLEAQVKALAAAVTEDFDHYLFLSRLALDLRLLQPPDPDRELRDLEAPLSTPAGDSTRAEIDRHRVALRAMTGRREPDDYHPADRMLKALQVGTLEETYRWLQAAVAENPASTVQDLMTRAAIEVAEAKLELDRYDDLKNRPDDHRAR